MHNGAPALTLLEKNLSKKSVQHYKDKLETRKKNRRKLQEVYEKRLKRRDTYRTDVEERREKKDNLVYFDRTNYSIRWSFRPR